MPLFPKIQSPCPYQGDLSAVMDGDVCRLCARQVFDITDWTDGQRMAFLAGCEEEVCVSYRLPLRAAAMAAAFVAAPALAAAQEPVAAPPVEAQANAAAEGPMIIVMGGGIKEPSHVEFVAVPEAESAPELPVVYEEAPPEQPAKSR